MEDFNFLNYCTIYKAEGDINKSLDEHACFSKVFQYHNEKLNFVKYTIIMHLDNHLILKSKNNWCLFDKYRIKKHINLLKTIIPNTKSVVHVKDNKCTITFSINNAKLIKHKYALTWIRYMYEYPYNVILYDAYKLKKLNQFRFTSIANLFNLVLSKFYDNPRDIHQIARNSINKKLTIKQLKSKLNQITRLNDIYKSLKAKTHLIPYKINNLSIHDIEYWLSDECFEERLKIYLK